MFNAFIIEIMKIVSVFENNSILKAEALEIIESNIKFKKFCEILFVLKSNLKEITLYLDNSEKISLEKEEITELICSIFQKSVKRDDIIQKINHKYS